VNTKIRMLLLIGACTVTTFAALGCANTDQTFTIICSESDRGIECRSVQDTVPDNVVEAVAGRYPEIASEALTCEGSSVTSSLEDAGRTLSTAAYTGACTGRTRTGATVSVLFTAQQLSNSLHARPDLFVQTRYAE
jgi:hypothetical protein